MRIRIIGDAAPDAWEGSLEELLETNLELPEHTRMRIERLRLEEEIRLDFQDQFSIRRIE
jgi:hypothetical protein